MSFSLIQVIERVLDESESMDPIELADEVLHAIDRRYYRDALAQTLPDYVRDRIRTVRRSFVGQAMSDIQRSTADEAADILDGATSCADTQCTSAPSNFSHRWAGVAGYFAKRIFTPGDEGYKRIGDLTRDDVLALAGHRHQLAKANEVAGDGFDSLHALMLRRRVKTVGELPEAEVRELLS